MSRNEDERCYCCSDPTDDDTSVEVGRGWYRFVRVFCSWECHDSFYGV